MIQKNRNKVGKGEEGYLKPTFLYDTKKVNKVYFTRALEAG